MSNIYRYLLPKAGGGWIRRYYQHKKLMVSMELLCSDAAPMLPISLFDFTRNVDIADATPTISSTTIDGWTVSDDGVINGASTSNAVLIRTNHCWYNHLQSKTKTTTAIQHHQRSSSSSNINNKTISSSSASATPSSSQQQQNISNESTPSMQHRVIENDDEPKSISNSDNDDSNNNTVELLSRPYIRWYGNLNTKIGLESKVQRSGFCAIRSPIFPFDGASLHGLYSYLEITCRYIPVVVPVTKSNHTTTQQKPPIIPSSSSPTITTMTQLSNHVNIHHDQSLSTRKPQVDSPLLKPLLPPQSEPTRIFTLNLRVTSALNDDIYQGHLSLDHPIIETVVEEICDSGSSSSSSSTNDDDISLRQHEQQQSVLPPFRTFVIPFDELLLTARGREREFQRRLMGSVDIESIGFLLMDNIEGPFQFDIATIRAVNRLDDGTVYESPNQISRVSTPSSPIPSFAAAAAATTTTTTTTAEDDEKEDVQNERPPTVKRGKQH